MTARLKDLALGVVATAVLVVSTTMTMIGEALAAPSGEVLGPSCWIRASTGHDCPTCGMTRSFVAFFHGDLGDAFEFHPMGPALALGTLVVLLSVVGLAVTRRSPLWGRPGFARTVAFMAVGALITGLARNWVGGF